MDFGWGDAMRWMDGRRGTGTGGREGEKKNLIREAGRIPTEQIFSFDLAVPWGSKWKSEGKGQV